MSYEALQATIILFGLLGCFIGWFSLIEEMLDPLKASLYFVGIAAASSLFTIGWIIHG